MERRPAELDWLTFRGVEHPRLASIVAGACRNSSRNYLCYTDDFSYNIAEYPVRVHNSPATLLRLLGLNHERLTCWKRQL